MDIAVYPPLPGSFEQLAVAASAVPLTPAKYTNRSASERGRSRTAVRARITVDTASIRYTVDGTTPTSSLGHSVAAGGEILLEGFDAIRMFRAIQNSGAAVINVTYYGI